MRCRFYNLCFFLLTCISLTTYAQKRSISGTVSDDSGPLPGVSIQIKGTQKGTETDFNGKYTITARKGNVLIFSFIGMKPKEVVVGNSNTINVKLASDNTLDEVVVIGYGSQDRNKLVQSVSTVTNENIKDMPATSPQELLQGQASGVQVVNSSGILGAAPVIKIRGVASISSGGRPLIVIDGVPLNDSVVTQGQGGVPLNPLSDINPNDIESFNVLKDAAATAIYGSRGANGVILITTKSGRKNQDTRVSLDFNTSFSKSTDIFDMMNADEYRSFRVERARPNDPASVSDFPQTSYNWAPNVVRTGVSKNVNLSLNGGDEKTTYFLGLTHSNQEGFIIGNNLKKSSGRVNIIHDAKDWLKLGANISITDTENDRVGSANNTFAPLTTAFLQIPWVEPYDANGNFVNTGFLANVIAIEALDINDANSFRTIGNVFGEIKLFNDLKFKSSFGIDRTNLEQFQRSFEVNTAGGFGQSIINQQKKYVFTNTLTYNSSFSDSHNISTVIGMQYEEEENRATTVNATGFLSDDQINTTSASTPGTTNNTVTASRLVGYFVRANYSYQNKYSLEGSVRRDGSSRFGANNRFGTFWAVGGAWQIHNEEFFDSSIINKLKLRANYGVAGNDRIGDYASLENFGGGIVSNYNGFSGLRQLGAANPNLKWERSASFNVGFETALFNNRLRLNVDYYNKQTSDLILNVPIPNTNGGLNSIIDNVGKMENKGFDIDISGDIINTKDFTWTTSLNIGLNKNKVLSLPGANLDDQGRRFVAGSAEQRAIEGHSVNSFYLIRYKGVNPDTGHAEWLDIDGNVTTNPTAADRVITGDANPDAVGGFRNIIKYKNFDLNLFFNYSLGNDIYISGLRFTDNPVSGFNKRRLLLDVWRNPGDNSYLPSFGSPTIGTFSQRSTLQMKDGSFIRLKNVTFGYTFSKSVLDKIGFLDSVRLYATASNLFTIKDDELKGIDPEVTNSINNGLQGQTFFTPPQSKSYLFGLRVTF